MNTFRLEECFAKYEFSAQYLLCCSDAESFAMSEILEIGSAEDRNLWDNLRLGYTESQGLPILRQKIAENVYADCIAADNILN